MGLLAESKSGRRKLSRDPNNTRWTRDESSFGQKMLRAQGWQPGQLLGAQNGSTSELHGAANASFIRVSLKDDLKGLGYNKALEDKVTGLDVFCDVLSRLNGKSEEDIEKKRQARLAMETDLYVQRRWGTVRFVRGGLLVGDVPVEETGSRSEEKIEADGLQGDKSEGNDIKAELTRKTRKSKKRKLADVDAENVEMTKEEKRRRKEEKRARKVPSKPEQDSPNSGNKDAVEPDLNMEQAEDDAAADKPRMKSKSKEKARRQSAEETEKDKSKSDKKERRDKKKKKKRRGEAEGEANGESKAEATATATTTTTTTTTTAAAAANGHRNFVRARFIAAKRQAMLDTQALKQIFMVQA
ncbi:PinX1- protein [Ophiocordyceps camponoti-floridani]|uniref:PinX1- protein n=1 Tax=Ophiocordyceps camponoti-floridani TaxID=2030778 RepID=A0A8H4Q144_9HYPO|nr:PinX1- protein [Ophiocordyceps camponoti-floridani]